MAWIIGAWRFRYVIGAVLLVVAFAAGYWYITDSAYNRGYNAAQAEWRRQVDLENARLKQDAEEARQHEAELKAQKDVYQKQLAAQTARIAALSAAHDNDLCLDRDAVNRLRVPPNPSGN